MARQPAAEAADSAVTDDLIPANPAHIRGAGNSKRAHQIEPASLTGLEAGYASGAGRPDLF
jgi:hypothetical protein